LQFLDSADPHAQTKYGSPQQEWVLQQGDRLVVGSLGTDRTMTMYKRPVDIYIPDAMMARRHAELYGEATSFFIQRHPDNSGLDGRPHTTLQVNGDDVTRPRELRSGDEILLGQTRLRFCSKRQQPTRAQSGERR
jgi:pSer/pThr/pTyr-binding forkhead associated (FHA) protein